MDNQVEISVEKLHDRYRSFLTVRVGDLRGGGTLRIAEASTLEELQDRIAAVVETAARSAWDMVKGGLAEAVNEKGLVFTCKVMPKKTPAPDVQVKTALNWTRAAARHGRQPPEWELLDLASRIMAHPIDLQDEENLYHAAAYMSRGSRYGFIECLKAVAYMVEIWRDDKRKAAEKAGDDREWYCLCTKRPPGKPHIPTCPMSREGGEKARETDSEEQLDDWPTRKEDERRARALSHLRELEAGSVPNPSVKKAVAMRRLLNEGADSGEAKKAVDEAYYMLTKPKPE